MMHEKFSGIPTDPETTIVFRQMTTIQGYNALLEMWVRNDIMAQSAIFYAADVAALSDEDLIKMVQVACKAEDTTLSRKNTPYVFVNWGFEPLS